MRIVVAMRDAVDRLEAALATAFDQHELAPISRSKGGWKSVVDVELAGAEYVD